MYYVYDFSEMLSELESIEGKSTEILTELRQIRSDQQAFYDKVYEGFHTITVFILIGIACKVLFK